MRITTFYFTLAACLLAATSQPCRADIIVTDLNGYFFAPVGGTNAGEGTAIFGTGEPFGAGDFSNVIRFFPYTSIYASGPTLTLPSDEVGIGIFRFYNGITAPGTSATSVGFLLNGTATLLDLNPPEQRPVGAERRIYFEITPNLTGDPFRDGDIWSSDNGSRALIPEGASIDFEASGRFVPRQIASPPRYYDFEFTRFTPVDAAPPAAVPAPPAALLALLGAIPAAWFVRRRKGDVATAGKVLPGVVEP